MQSLDERIGDKAPPIIGGPAIRFPDDGVHRHQHHFGIVRMRYGADYEVGGGGQAVALSKDL